MCIFQIIIDQKKMSDIFNTCFLIILFERIVRTTIEFRSSGVSAGFHSSLPKRHPCFSHSVTNSSGNDISLS